jgi:hypothetical protein
VIQEDENINMSFTPFDLYTSQLPLNFKLGPTSIKMPEQVIHSDRYFSISQLHLIFTDLRNLLANTDGNEEISLVMEEGPSNDSPTDSKLALGNLNMHQIDADTIPDDVLKHEGDMENNASNDDGNVARQVQIPDNTEKNDLESALRKMEEFKVNLLAQRFRYRVKNNHIGALQYFPPKWNGKDI